MKRQSFLIVVAFVSIPAILAAHGKVASEVIASTSAAPADLGIIVKSSTPTWSMTAQAQSDKLPQAVHELKAPDPAVRARAITLFAGMGGRAKSALPALTDALSDPQTQKSAAAAIREIDPGYTVPTSMLARLVRIAKEPPERDRVRTGWITRCDAQASALDTLGALGPAAHSAIPELVRLTHRPCIHEHVVQALTQLGAADDSQLSQIAVGLKEKNPEARQAAVEYLAQSGGDASAETTEALGRSMNDPNSGVRLAALQALEDIHPEGEGRLPELAGFLKDPSPDIRQRALFMIGKMGSQAMAALPYLHMALQDSEAVVALSSAKMIAAMDPNDDVLIHTLINFMKDKGSAQGQQAAEILESLNIHDARIDSALEPYRQQNALRERLSDALSGKTPEMATDNARTLKVQSMRVASGIVQNQPVHSARVFLASVGRLYCWTDVSVSSAPATLIHRWYRNGRLAHEAYLQVPTTSARLWSSAPVRSGDWRVDVVPAGVTDPLATAVFTVSHSN